MRRLLALLLVAAALGVAAPAHATCEGVHAAGACVSYGCTGDPCRIDPKTVTVTTYCQYPAPAVVCTLIAVHGGTK